MLTDERLRLETPTAAYIHIPFCRRRCYYCDFAISVVGDRPPLARQGKEEFGTIAEYVEYLGQEIRATAAAEGFCFTTSPSCPPPQALEAKRVLQSGQILEAKQSLESFQSSPVLRSKQPLQTIFFGGGTPSLLTVPQLAQILELLDQQFGIAADAEISMEIDPDTFDRARLQGYRAAGINRVSLGVQAFQTKLLQACGRTHRREDIETAVQLIHQVGLSNFSLDLISGLPHQTLADWQESLEAAIALCPTHLSVYDLTVEPGTAFERWYQPGTQPLPTDEMTAQMYRLAQQKLTQAGFEHYEISNYAQPGYACRHNRVYWKNQAYYGFGMAAASYQQQRRWTRPRTRPSYYQWVEDFSITPQIDCPITPELDVLLETLMLGLRLAEGLSLRSLAARFGVANIQQVLTTLQPYREKGWVKVGIAPSTDPLGDERLQFSDPEGFLFSNVVLSALFQALAE